MNKLLYFLNKYPASTPRKTVGRKVIQDKLCYHFFYLSTKRGDRLSTKTWKYSPPNIGGNFKIPRSTFVHFPFLLQFGRYKAITALMLQELHTIEGLTIARTSAQQEIAHLQHAWDLYDSIPHETSNEVKETAIALKDIFNGKMPSLENKTVFSIPGDIREGRGGSNGNYFHYALLDWGDRQVKRRRFLLDRNAIRPEQRATQHTLDDYLVVNPEQAVHFNQALASAECRRRTRNLRNNNNN